MSRTLLERVATWTVIAAFAALWVIVFGLGEPPELPSQYFFSAVMMAFLATPWAIAARLLARAWWAQDTARADMDGPALLLELALATLPESRREWGTAMAAELTMVQGRAERWSFAGGCARTALLPPAASRTAVIVAATLALIAASSTGPAVGRALPALRVFAVSFVVISGVIVTLVVARGRRVRVARDPITTGWGLLGVALFIVCLTRFLVDYPSSAAQLTPIVAALWASVLCACLWCVLSPPRAIAASRFGQQVGALGACALLFGFLWTSSATVHTLAGPVIWVMFAPPVICFVASALAARFGRGFGAGVQAAVWSVLFGALWVCCLWIPEAVERYSIDARLLLDGEMGHAVEENLGDVLWIFIAIPLLGLPFGVIGAALGRRLCAAPQLLSESPR